MKLIPTAANKAVLAEMRKELRESDFKRVGTSPGNYQDPTTKEIWEHKIVTTVTLGVDFTSGVNRGVKAVLFIGHVCLKVCFTAESLSSTLYLIEGVLSAVNRAKGKEQRIPLSPERKVGLYEGYDAEVVKFYKGSAFYCKHDMGKWRVIAKDHEWFKIQRNAITLAKLTPGKTYQQVKPTFRDSKTWEEFVTVICDDGIERPVDPMILMPLGKKKG
jgi:hypothetical protein